MREIENLKKELLQNLWHLKREGYGRFFMMEQTHKEKLFGFINRGKTTNIEIVGQKRPKGSAKVCMEFQPFERTLAEEFIKVAEDVIKMMNR